MLRYAALSGFQENVDIAKIIKLKLVLKLWALKSFATSAPLEWL